MQMNEYQIKAAVTAKYPEAGTGSAMALAYTALGLGGEAGEVSNKVKKILRDAGGEVTEEVRQTIAQELGDVLWYIAMMLAELEYPMSNIAEGNIAKLWDRKARGVIGGSGDNR